MLVPKSLCHRNRCCAFRALQSSAGIRRLAKTGCEIRPSSRGDRRYLRQEGRPTDVLKPRSRLLAGSSAMLRLLRWAPPLERVSRSRVSSCLSPKSRIERCHSWSKSLSFHEWHNHSRDGKGSSLLPAGSFL